MECCDYIDSDFDVAFAARVVAFVLAHSSVKAEADQILKVVEQADAACLTATAHSITGDRFNEQQSGGPQVTDRRAPPCPRAYDVRD